MDNQREPSLLIIGILKIYPNGLSISAISRKIHLNRNSVAKYLDSLHASSQVEVENVGMNKIYKIAKKSPVPEKASKEQLEQNRRDFEFISQSASNFINLQKNSNIYDIIGTGVNYLVPDAVVSISTFDKKSSSITVKSFVGDDDNVFAEYFRNMLDLNMPIGDPEVVNIMASGILHQVPGGVHITTFGQIPVYSSAKIENSLPVRSIWSIGLASCKNLFCVATMFKRDINPPQNQDLISTYARMATLGLLKRTP